MHYYPARALVGLKRWREAAAHYEAALRQLPAYTAAHVGLADAHLADGKPRAALEALQRGQKALPNDPRLVDAKATSRAALAIVGAAGRVLGGVAPLAPKDALVRVKLGELLSRRRAAGRCGARCCARRSALDPTVASYWNSLGMVLGGSGDLPGAEQAFREATTRDRGERAVRLQPRPGAGAAEQAREAAAEFRARWSSIRVRPPRGSGSRNCDSPRNTKARRTRESGFAE